MRRLNERIIQGLDRQIKALLGRFAQDYKVFYGKTPLKELEDPLEKPWGSFLSFVMNDRANVKLISVLPHRSLSYQYHRKRGELWFILQNGVRVVLGDPEVLRGDPATAPLLKGAEDEGRLLGDEELAVLREKLRSFELSPGEFIYVPKGFIHTLINPSEGVAMVLEVAIGYFEEEDVIRIYDEFQRRSGTI